MEPARIPLARVKRVMKEDPEVMAVSVAAVKHMASAVQLFVGHFTEQALLAARAEGRTRVAYRDFAQVANSSEEMAFLGPLLPNTIPFGTVQSMRAAADIHDQLPGIPFPRKEEQLEAEIDDESD